MPLTVQITGDTSGVDTALARLQGAIDQRMSAVEARLESGARTTQQFSERSARHLQSVENATTSLTKHVEALSGAMVALFAAFQTGSVLSGFLQTVIQTGARTETLGVVLMQVAKNAGTTALQAGVARDQIKALGVTTQEASSITARFIQANLGLAEAIKLANVARNAAVVADQNTSQALNGLVQGILTLQQETLRTYGIFVNLSQANDEFAKANKRDVELLTVYEKQQIALNAVLKQGVALNGTYEAALGTVGKQLTSLNRIIEESHNILGTRYLPIVGLVVQAVTNLLIGFQGLPGPVQTATASIVGAAAVVGTLTVAVAALVRIGQVLAVTSLFTGWGPVILAIGAATAGVIALTNALSGAGATDPAKVLTQSLGALDSKIAQTERLLKAQEKSQHVMQEQLKAAPENQAGIEIVSRQTTRVNELRAALEALKKTREELGRPIPLPPPMPPPAAPPGDDAKRLQAVANLAKAQEEIIQESLKRQEALIAQSFDERRIRADEFFAEQVRAAPGEAEEIGRARLAAMRLITQEEATMLEAVRLESNNRLLAASVDQLNKEKAAHAGKVADIAKIEGSLQAAYEEHGARQEAIFAKTAAVRQQLSKQATDEEIKDLIRANDILEKSREQGLEDFAKQTRQIEQEMAREQDRIQTSQLRSYENFVNRVAGLLNDIFTGLLDGTLNAVDFFKRLLIAQLANIGSTVLAPFVAGIAASVAGALASALPSSIGAVIGQGVFGPAGAPAGGLQGLLGGAGLVNTLMGPTSLFSQGVNFFSKTLLNAGTSISQLFGGPILGQLPAGVTMEGVANVNPLQSLGGLIAGITGLISAITGKGTGAQVVGGLGSALGFGATIPGPQQPFLLAASAITQIIGPMIAKMFSPGGPRFALGGLGGLGVGLGAGGLQVTGDLTSRVGATDRLPGGTNVSAIQDALQSRVSALVRGMVETINRGALRPVDLLGETQEALNAALREALVINSGSAKNFQKDIEEQTKFIGVQVSSFFLRPLNDAFRQLESSTLEDQLARLPQTTEGMAQVFKSMNDQLAELEGVANTDVLRQLSSVRNRVEDFGNALSDTARVVSESIVNSITDTMVAHANVLLDEPLALQITGFADVLGQSFQALNVLRSAQKSLESVGLSGAGVGDQLARLTQTMVETAGTMAEHIVTGVMDSFATVFDRPLAQQITQFADVMNQSLSALGLLRGAQQAFQEAGLPSGGVGDQLARLTIAIQETAAHISTQLVTTAMQELSANLDQVLIQPLRVQAATITGVFADSLAVLQTLITQRQNLSGVGIDVSGIERQIERLIGGMLNTTFTVLDQAINTGAFGEFLDLLVSIPDAVADLNPQLAALKQLGLAFAQVVGPIADAITTLEDELRTTAERVTFTETRMSDLRSAIADAGNSAAQALPLYAQLSEAIQANAAAQIAAVNEVADAQITAAQEAAEAQLDAVHQASDAQIDSINAMADAQLAAINAWADAWTTAINDAVDAQRALLADWVEVMTAAVNEWASTAQTTAGQLQTVNEILLAEKSPAAQRQALLAREAELAAIVAAGGPAASAAMSELIRVEQQLLALAKQSDNLKAQKESIEKLEKIQKALRDQLVALTGQSDPVLAQIAIAETQKLYLKAISEFNTKYAAYLEGVQAVYLKAIADEQARQVAAIEASRTAQIDAVNASRDAEVLAINTARDAQIKAIEEARDAQVQAIKVDVINQLKALESALKTLFAGQDVVNGTLHVPVPVHLVQRGGLLGMASGSYYARGGMVDARVEPGESYWTNYTAQQGQALLAVNRAFPRFADGGMVPGSGDGDRVSMRFPPKTIVVNRTGTNAMRGRGFQGGGMVDGGSSGGGVPVVNIHIAKLEVRNDQDIRAIIDGITKQLRREWRSPNGGGPFR